MLNLKPNMISDLKIYALNVFALATSLTSLDVAIKISTGTPINAKPMKKGKEVKDEYHEFRIPSDRLKCSPS